MSDVTRIGPWQVREVPQAASAGLTGQVCQAIVREHRARAVRRAELHARYGCIQPPWAAEYIRHGRIREREREAG